MKLYGENCLNVNKVLYAASILDIELERIKFSFEDLRKGEKTADGLGLSDYEKINPFLRSPVLAIDTDHHMIESVAIARYLDKISTKKYKSLFGENDDEQAKIEIYARVFEVDIQVASIYLLRAFGHDGPTAPVAKEKLNRMMRVIEKKLKSDGYLATPYYAMDDVMLVTSVEWVKFKKVLEDDFFQKNFPTVESHYQKLMSDRAFRKYDTFYPADENRK